MSRAFDFSKVDAALAADGLEAARHLGALRDDIAATMAMYLRHPWLMGRHIYGGAYPREWPVRGRPPEQVLADVRRMLAGQEQARRSGHWTWSASHVFQLRAAEAAIAALIEAERRRIARAA